MAQTFDVNIRSHLPFLEYNPCKQNVKVLKCESDQRHKLNKLSDWISSKIKHLKETILLHRNNIKKQQYSLIAERENISLPRSHANNQNESNSKRLLKVSKFELLRRPIFQGFKDSYSNLIDVVFPCHVDDRTCTSNIRIRSYNESDECRHSTFSNIKEVYTDNSNQKAKKRENHDNSNQKAKKRENQERKKHCKIYRQPCNSAWISVKVGVGITFQCMRCVSGMSFCSIFCPKVCNYADFLKNLLKLADFQFDDVVKSAKVVVADTEILEKSENLDCSFENNFPVSVSEQSFYFEEESNFSKYSSPPGTRDMKEELSRLVSFQDFPETIPANPNMLSRTGFYYTGYADNVRCFFCSNTVSAVHSSLPFDLSMHRSNCQFALEKGGCGNISLDHADSRPAAADANVAVRPAGDILRGTPQFAQTTTTSQRNRSIPLERPMANVLSSAHSRLLERLNLLVEVDRLKSFSSWPSMPPRPTARSMARAGFFYLGNLDRTQCFSCGGVLRNWRRNDDPQTEHCRHFSHCKMARGLETLNVKDDTPLPPQVSTSSHERFSLSSEERRNLQLMFPCEQPVTPHMKALHLRVETFKHWTFTNATDYSIAVAGFFSLNVRDKVKCFHCNGGLQNWQRNDDPWEEHAKWYPTCEFLLQMKGPDYVHSVVARFPDLNRPILQSPGNDVPPPTQNQRMVSTSRGFSAPEIIDPQREVLKLLDDAMKSEVTDIVVGMGFEEKIVRAVMKSHIQEHGKPYETATALLEAVTSCDEEAMDTEESTKLPTAQTQTRKLQDEFTERPAMLSYEAAPSSSASATLLASSGSNGDAKMKSSESLEMKPSQCAEIKSIESVEMMESEEIIEDEGELEKRLEQLIDERVCKVCLDKPADVVFIPCGHICCCLSCTQALRKCPICREKIEKGVRTYTS